MEEVGFRTTPIRRFDKSLVTVPNSTFSSTPMVNHSERPIRRIGMVVGVSYEASAEQHRGILAELRGLITSHPDVDQGFNFVRFGEFGDSSLNLQIYCFTKSTVWTEFRATREDLMLQVMDLLETRGLEMAFPPVRSTCVTKSGLHPILRRPPSPATSGTARARTRLPLEPSRRPRRPLV